MTFNIFRESLTDSDPPKGLTLLIQALWQDAKGNWEQAHNLAQQESSRDGSWVHAYLHRKEEDIGNASYWYSRAGKPVSKLSLDEEWEEIVKALLE
ncbi:hypothetical protein IIC38_03645 [candidate division KSB1 bacterium]|nr:hypothetical protein [candidate division KSB1 bacterium]